MATRLDRGFSVRAKTPEDFVTSPELAALPKGSVVSIDGELGEIVIAGPIVSILWPQSSCTNLIDTKSKKWDIFVCWLEVE
jgi:hypothetical protein